MLLDSVQNQANSLQSSANDELHNACSAILTLSIFRLPSSHNLSLRAQFEIKTRSRKYGGTNMADTKKSKLRIATLWRNSILDMQRAKAGTSQTAWNLQAILLGDDFPPVVQITMYMANNLWSLRQFETHPTGSLKIELRWIEAVFKQRNTCQVNTSHSKSSKDSILTASNAAWSACWKKCLFPYNTIAASTASTNLT